MLSKKWVVGVTSVLLVILLVTGYIAIAAEGSREDPLVTVSYIETLLPKLSGTIDEAIAKKTAEFDTAINVKVDEVNQTIDDKISRFEEQYAAGFSNDAFVSRVAAAILDKTGNSSFVPSDPVGEENEGNPAGGNSALFQTVRFKSGTTIIGAVGTEILWRIGTAVCVAPGSPGLIDATTAEDLANGGQLKQNHLYIITMAEGRGFRTTSDCVILIKGPYTAQ